MSTPIVARTSRQVAFTIAQFAKATNLSLLSIDSKGDIEFANPSACKLFGYEQSEMIGQPIMIIIPERLRGAHMAGLQRVAGGQAPHLGGRPVEVSALKKDGTEFPIEITLSVWSGKRGFCAGAIITDISDRREREVKLLRLASQDTLTGLLNRHGFSTLLSECLESGSAASIILLDLDGFKEVNDTHGHVAGDCLLEAIGVRLPNMLGRNTHVARIGGDEFALLLQGVNDPIEAHALAQAVLKTLRKPFDLGGQIHEIGTSIGIALAPSHGTDTEELLASADFALYRAKAEGGNVIRLYDPTMRSETAARRELRDELLQALRGGELELFYQPQVNLLDKRIVGLEALLRWHHPQRGLLSPGAFLPALDQSTLALEIGWWTLDKAAERAGELRANGHDIKVSVNLFPGQLRAPNLIHKIADALQRHSVKADKFELEVTETIALADDDRSFDAMTLARDLGVGIAFDDFGTGYASLSSLQRYPITTLKIDRSFVQNINEKPGDIAITRALIGLSHEMGLKTIVEGIETLEQERTLIQLGCCFGQGYLYGKPMPFRKIVDILEPTTLPPQKIWPVAS
ncbi:putative signaling protein [Agrobacterium rubi TR3 = NBRC 13261]|uniref:Putative signaling protein n=1 Tax=Agrobacterium rubi TR3 = NBRC 13261 TaxID=1368415 RepID=A0A081CS31_9HYPH|nr:EAL domain-containing protein [Agrobacterium rubi]MBP1879010.1 diguanylate cyclase (GGDEF)-like protein/PAS domain S-box-containing protein [Agrobacterium rubi]GAK69477.1 putative signaling protein [Agrobacterium rubi TR3 = NBRC 13261]